MICRYIPVTVYCHGSTTHQSCGRPKFKTIEPSGSALWPDLLLFPDICGRRLQRHVRRLTYPAKWRL